MSLITFTVRGMSKEQAADLSACFQLIAQHLNEHAQEIVELQAEIAKLKAEPRMSLAQKLRSKR